MLISLFLVWAVHAASPESALIRTFDKAKTTYAKFSKDTMKYRAEVEDYNENEFEPAVESMIGLLSEKKCGKCVPSYLKGLSYLDGSASEVLTDQLKRIISKHPEALSAGCGKIDAVTRKKLSVRFSDAITFLSQDNKVERGGIEKSVKGCL